MPDLLKHPAGAGTDGFGDAARPRTRAGPAAAHRYDAFMSYSHAADGRLAPALRNGLQRLATPWRVLRWRNPVRALHIFQDEASLSANPALWPTIENALGSAEWFILLASPEARGHPGSRRKSTSWCLHVHKSPERLLIVQTDGEIAWGRAANDFEWVGHDGVASAPEHGFHRRAALDRRPMGAYRRTGHLARCALA